jgi:hypothetical protein
MIIRNILFITVIAALVPTAMSNVSASAGSEIALFSGVSDSDGLSISGNGDTAKMELKATNDNGKSNRISDFQLTADNVLSTEVGDKATVIDNVDFTKAVTTDARNNQKAIGITSNGVIDFTGYIQGVYTLDVVVDDDRAYEAIIAIGDQTNQIVDKEITRVNYDYTIKFGFLPIEDPKPPKCNEGEELIDGKCVPIECDEGEELIDGKCVPFDCPAHAGGCETPCKPSGDLDVCYPWDDEEPEPPIDCDTPGFVLQGNECVGLEPVCDGATIPCPPTSEPIARSLEVPEPEEPAVLEDQIAEDIEEDAGPQEGDIDGDGEGNDESNEEGNDSEGGDDSDGSEESGGSESESEGSEESGGSDGETSE